MPKVTGLGHVGLFVKDMPMMVEFYTSLLGLTLTDQGPKIAFLSARPEEEHHELALALSPDRHTDPQQVSFTCATLSDLREFYRQVVERNLRINHVVSHGNAFGCYFHDPEDNMVEVYWHTGKDWPQPYGDPIDLSKSEEELMALLDAMPAYDRKAAAAAN